MSLSSKLKEFQVQCLCKIPENPNPCLVIGSLFEHPNLEDRLDKFSLLSPFDAQNEKIDFFGKYEVGSEEGVLSLLLEFSTIKTDKGIEDFLNELDIGYISAESNLGEEEIQELAKRLKNSNAYIVICEDLEHHVNAENIAKLLSMLAYYGNYKIIYEKLDKEIKSDKVTIAHKIDELNSFDGAVVYFTNQQLDGMLGSSQFALANRLNDGDMVLIKTKNGEQKRRFKISKELKGTIGLLQIKHTKNTYAYEVSKISRIENE